MSNSAFCCISCVFLSCQVSQNFPKTYYFTRKSTVQAKMGSILGTKRKNQHILLLGLDAAGKTTIMYKAMHDIIHNTFFTIDAAEYRGHIVTCWDLGSSKLRPIYRQYYPSTNGIIFVVDSIDHERLSEAYNQFHQMLWDMPAERRDCPILLLCNKQDSPHAIGVDHIQKAMGFFRSISLNPSEMQDVHRNSMLRQLPIEIVEIVLEYAVHFENGISVKWNPFLFQNSDI